MPKQKEQQPLIYVGLSSIILSAFLIILFISFYYILHQQVPTKLFGWQQIAMAIVVAIIATICLGLSRGIMYRNPALGVASGLAMLILALFALFSAYTGPNTMKFAIIGSIGVIVYLGIAFWKSARN